MLEWSRARPARPLLWAAGVVRSQPHRGTVTGQASSVPMTEPLPAWAGFQGARLCAGSSPRRGHPSVSDWKLRQSPLLAESQFPRFLSRGYCQPLHMDFSLWLLGWSDASPEQKCQGQAQVAMQVVPGAAHPSQTCCPAVLRATWERGCSDG
jgi:hypothetical protein